MNKVFKGAKARYKKNRETDLRGLDNCKKTHTVFQSAPHNGQSQLSHSPSFEEV